MTVIVIPYIYGSITIPRPIFCGLVFGGSCIASPLSKLLRSAKFLLFFTNTCGIQSMSSIPTYHYRAATRLHCENDSPSEIVIFVSNDIL